MRRDNLSVFALILIGIVGLANGVEYSGWVLAAGLWLALDY